MAEFAVKTCGLTVCVVGLGIEGLAIMSMNWWELRRRLPGTPLDLLGRGCFCFCVGSALVATAGLLK